MQKKILISYAIILGVLLLMLSLSRPATEKLRGKFASFFSPLWEKMTSVKNRISNREMPTVETYTGLQITVEEEIERLKLENRLLSNELLFLEQLAQIKHTFPLTTDVLPARVIFRSMDTWNSSLWINVGEENNAGLVSPIIAKNSPVLVGDSIVGVVDFVGPRQSRVMLITDPRLTPSVRAARGGAQEALTADHIEFLLHSLQGKNKFSISEDDKKNLVDLLAKLKKTLAPEKKSWLLAKGELRGNAKLEGRTHSQILKGTGFNYDFTDEAGEAKDLRTGKLITDPKSASMSLLKVNDLLVTTGMDGVFPPHLKVATITKIALLKEGDYYYELEAKPTAGDLNSLSLVFVIPPR